MLAEPGNTRIRTVRHTADLHRVARNEDWLIDAIDAMIEKANRRSVVPGIQTRTVEQAAFWANRGMRFVGAGGEHGLLLGAARTAAAALREAHAAAVAGDTTR